jgi:hypothetical protein
MAYRYPSMTKGPRARRHRNKWPRRDRLQRRGSDHPGDLWLGRRRSDIGSDSTDTIYAGPGDDDVRGGLEIDILFGEDGNDTLRGGALHDFLDGDLDDYYSRTNMTRG